MQHDSADEKVGLLMLSPDAMKKYGQYRKLRKTAFFEGAGKYHVLIYQTKSPWNMPIVLNTEDFGFFEFEQNTANPGRAAPRPEGMPPLEKGGFPIIVK